MAQLALEFLGTGGAFRTPRPGCQCALCQGAREHGIPWERTGPSLFVHGPDVLIDTPEESCLQVDRSRIRHIAAGFYSHWHPDHTAGRRMYETRNWDALRWPPQNTCTPIYLPPQVAADFETYLGLAENFRYLESRGLVKVHPFDGPLTLGGWQVTAFPLAESYVYAFLFQELDGHRRVLIAMDELLGWTPPPALAGVELAVLPAGVFEFHPLTGRRLIPADHPVLQTEATFRQTLAMVEQLRPQRLIFAHLEEPFGLTPPELERLAEDLGRQRGWDVTFAYDTLMVEL
ncbi:MBL fold metallo-hydrolase [Litorilinea aerophila]|nr:MBL fold metallo-hydrolase [Litorilinea aerophila]MCC9078639.1 MBL fold metallo-hydrolase [Litorilinea aerophila]GIV77422.1 MAG: hypothetical protein KatS3mg050_1816 [Litorilinea sp.]